MTLEEFSTQESVEQRANAERINLWTDDNDDSTPDPGVLTQGFQEASGLIFEYLKPRFGESQLSAWTIATAPARILRFSDAICIWIFSSRNFSQNPLIQTLYDQAIDSLEQIADGSRGLFGATEQTAGKTQTVRAVCPGGYCDQLPLCPDPVFFYARPWGCV